MEKLQVSVQERIGHCSNSRIGHSGGWKHYGGSSRSEIATQNAQAGNQLFEKGEFGSSKVLVRVPTTFVGGVPGTRYQYGDLALR